MKESNARWDEGKGRVKDALLGRYQSNVLSGLPSPPPLKPQKNGDSGEEAGFWQMRNLLLDTWLGYGRTPVLGSEHRTRGTVKREQPQVSGLEGWT